MIWSNAEMSQAIETYWMFSVAVTPGTSGGIWLATHTGADSPVANSQRRHVTNIMREGFQ
jgi:hypothetical protein